MLKFLGEFQYAAQQASYVAEFSRLLTYSLGVTFGIRALTARIEPHVDYDHNDENSLRGVGVNTKWCSLFERR